MSDNKNNPLQELSRAMQEKREALENIRNKVSEQCKALKEALTDKGRTSKKI